MKAQTVRERSNNVDDSLAARIKENLIGQDEAVDRFIPYIEMHQAGLGPEGRPIGVILLLGQTGSGKTRSVIALAEALHGHKRNVLRVDCGEFQMEHEVAKLIGAPPGYLGHRETQPMLSQAKITGVTSDNSDISIILFDEIEKAAPSMTRILLGLFDTASIRLGDNNTVSFERSIVFLTSNIGVEQLKRLAGERFGIGAGIGKMGIPLPGSVQKIGTNAVRRQFSPEFFNRIDEVITYAPLGRNECEQILTLMLADFNQLIVKRLGMKSFTVHVTQAAREKILNEGVSKEYGARELKRVLQRRLMQPAGSLSARGEVQPGAVVNLTVKAGEFEIVVKTVMCNEA